MKQVSLKGVLAEQVFKDGTRGATEWKQWIEAQKQELSKVMERNVNAYDEDEIGKYGLMRWEYLKNHRRDKYIKLLMDGQLNEHLYVVDAVCYERMEFLLEQMKVGAGITEELKESDQMQWVGLMNNVRSSAEEIVVKELIYV